jgi:hypothetical protein
LRQSQSFCRVGLGSWNMAMASDGSSYMAQWLRVGSGKQKATVELVTAPLAWLELAKCMSVPTARALPGVFTVLASAAAAATAAAAAAAAPLVPVPVTVPSLLPPQAHVAVSNLLEVVGAEKAGALTLPVVLEACVVAAHGLGTEPRLSTRAWRTLVKLVRGTSQRACAAKAVSKAFADEPPPPQVGSAVMAAAATAVTAAAGAKIAVLELLLCVLWRCPAAVCSAELRRCPAAAAHLWMHRVFAPRPLLDGDCDMEDNVHWSAVGGSGAAAGACATAGGGSGGDKNKVPVFSHKIGLSAAVSVLSAALIARLASGQTPKAAAKAMCCWWLAKPVPTGTPVVLCMDTECIVCRGTVWEDRQALKDRPPHWDPTSALSASECTWQTLRCGCVMHVDCLDRFASRKPGYWDNPKCLQCQREWLKLCICA